MGDFLKGELDKADEFFMGFGIFYLLSKIKRPGCLFRQIRYHLLFPAIDEEDQGFRKYGPLS